MIHAKVQFKHFRIPRKRVPSKKKGRPDWKFLRHYPHGRADFLPFEKGGATVCTVSLSDGRIFQGTSLCSLSDMFCYGTGRKLAFERALEKAAEAGITQIGVDNILIINIMQTERPISATVSTI